MRIAEVSIYPAKASKHVQSSGVASYTKNLLKGIPLEKGDELFVLCEKLPPDYKTAEYREDGFTIIRAFNRGTRFAGQLYRQLKRLKPDVIHFQQEVPLYGGLHTAYMLQWLLFALREQKVAITLHHVVNLRYVDKKFVRDNRSNLPPWLVRRAFRIIYKPLVRWASAIIVHEAYFKDILVQQYGAAAGKIHVIPHGVEAFTPTDTQKARRALSIRPEQKVVLFMGYLAGYKGFDLLLEGFARYGKDHPEALLILGAGKHPKFQHEASYLALYNGYQSKAAKLIPQNQYRWLGFIDESEVGAYYSASDVSLYPYTISMSSSGPMSFAVGYEKPFLASDVFSGVLPADILFARNPEAVAEKLAAFFENPQPAAQLSQSMKQARLWTTVGANTLQACKEM